MEKLQIKNVTFNEGAPKICIPLTGVNERQILNEIDNLKTVDYDLAELRIDFFENVNDSSKVKNLLENIRKIYYKPLLFTFRTKKEGGTCDISEDNYFRLNYNAIESRLIDLVDIELFSNDEKIKKIIKFAKKHQVKVIMSNHDFFKTPPKEEIIGRLVKMQEYGADIAKIAVMPNSEEDVLTLLSATLEIKKRKKPCITMSMGSLGVITRLTGELFGSCMTFATVKNLSAPGQVNAKNTRDILNLFHNS
ncbi:MAG: type I 3-dehydroquinate dehydratase [Sedimentibacter sp.]|uniref:type I 3-dehydroquinate dehydratase n=1 Tax=Sedimentibacter sp. TaxID=1960295 RepID=UPI002982B69B|nr:type I 3-dehydroquinate dehydratase [Sedimentibacter sp.]MDW5300186.1 type I 3-dehydroquinate dehydratase [Sedimentibacter sp.]